MRPPYPVIDAHVHIIPWEQVRPDAMARMAAGRDSFETVRAITRDPHRLVAFMDERGIEKLVYLDISSIPPQNLLNYFPWIERVASQAMFGSDWPGPDVKDPLRNIEDFYALPISEEAKLHILRGTAERLYAR